MEHILSNIFICFPLYSLIKINNKHSYLSMLIYFSISLILNLFYYEDPNLKHTLNDFNFIILFLDLLRFRKISLTFFSLNIFYYIFYLEFKESENDFAINFLWNTAIYYNLTIILNLKRRFRFLGILMG